MRFLWFCLLAIPALAADAVPVLTPSSLNFTYQTGSFLPATLSETYATADIIAYDGVRRVKVGREFLFD